MTEIDWSQLQLHTLEFASRRNAKENHAGCIGHGNFGPQIKFGIAICFIDETSKDVLIWMYQFHIAVFDLPQALASIRQSVG